MRIALAVASLMLGLESNTIACTFARGYFYQVTALKGRVVGSTWQGLPRWLRQSLARNHAKLVLYEYLWPLASWDEAPVVRTVETDSHGNFDFGLLRIGHYMLRC
jgi:hypothetical protein